MSAMEVVLTVVISILMVLVTMLAVRVLDIMSVTGCVG